MSAFAAAFPAAASRHRASTYGASASLGANAHAARYTSRHTLSSRSAFGWFEVCFRTWQYHSSRIAAPKASSRASASSSLFREKGSASFEKARVKKSELGFVCFVASVWARAFFVREELRSSPAWSSSARNSAAAALDAPSASAAAVSATRIGDDACDAAALGSSARGRRRASAERQNPKHPRSSRFFPAGSETEDFVKCVAAYASNGSRASWTRSESNAKTTGSGSGTEAFRAERRRVASRRSLSALFSSSRDVRPARSLTDSLIIKPGGTLSRLRSASSFALDTALGSARARSSAFVAFVRGHRGTSAPDFVAARARISRARLRARNPRARACSVVAALDVAAGSALRTREGEGRGETQPVRGGRRGGARRDDARRAGVGLRSETRGDGDGNAVGDEGLDETSDVFRDRVLVSGETDVVSATRLDSVATAMSVSANVRARTCSPYASLRSRADDDRRFRTSIFASVAGEGAAVPSAASRRGESVVAEGTEDTRGASARAAWARRPAPSPPPRASRLALGVPRRLCSRVFGDTKSARVPRAIPAGLEPGRFSSARTSATPAGARRAEHETRVRRGRFRRASTDSVTGHSGVETLSSGGGGARPRRSTQKAPSTSPPGRRLVEVPAARPRSARRARRARFRFFFGARRRRRPARRPIPFSSQPRPRRRRIVTLREKRRLPSRRATRASRTAPTAASPRAERRAASRNVSGRRLAAASPAASSSNRGLRTAPARPTAASPPASPATTRFPAASAGELSEAVPTTTRPFSGCSNTNHRWPCPSSGSSPHPAAPRAVASAGADSGSGARARGMGAYPSAGTSTACPPSRASYRNVRRVDSGTESSCAPRSRSTNILPNARGASLAVPVGARRAEAGRSSFCTDGDRARVVPVTRERRTAQPPLTASSNVERRIIGRAVVVFR